MANYNYTHGGTSFRNRLRLLLGDHRGTNGTSATGWVFSDEELDEIATWHNTTGAATTWESVRALIPACETCLASRINREAMSAGVAGTTDTTDRPAALINAMRNLKNLSIRNLTPAAQAETRSLEDLADSEEAF